MKPKEQTKVCNGELAKFNNDLRHLLFALYTISKESSEYHPLNSEGGSYVQ